MTGLDAEHDRVVAVPSGNSACLILLRSGGQRDRGHACATDHSRVSCARFRAACSETVALHVMTSKGLVVVVPPDILHSYARLDGNVRASVARSLSW